MRHLVFLAALLSSPPRRAGDSPVRGDLPSRASRASTAASGGATSSEPILTTSIAVQALANDARLNQSSVQMARAYLSGSRPTETVDLQARRLRALAGTALADTITAAAFGTPAQSSYGFGFLNADSLAPTLLESAQGHRRSGRRSAPDRDPGSPPQINLPARQPAAAEPHDPLLRDQPDASVHPWSAELRRWLGLFRREQRSTAHRRDRRGPDAAAPSARHRQSAHQCGQLPRRPPGRRWPLRPGHTLDRRYGDGHDRACRRADRPGHGRQQGRHLPHRHAGCRWQLG